MIRVLAVTQLLAFGCMLQVRRANGWEPLGTSWLLHGTRSYGALHEDNKTSVMLQVEDGPGALQETLKFFWKHDVNMTRIESRPAKGHNMNYCFYIDFEGKRGQPEVDELMTDLSKHCLDVMVLHDKKGRLDALTAVGLSDVWAHDVAWASSAVVSSKDQRA